MQSTKNDQLPKAVVHKDSCACQGDPLVSGRTVKASQKKHQNVNINEAGLTPLDDIAVYAALTFILRELDLVHGRCKDCCTTGTYVLLCLEMTTCDM